jgi:hypothetical protein
MSLCTDNSKCVVFDDYTQFSDEFEVLVEGMYKPIKKELRIKKEITRHGLV